MNGNRGLLKVGEIMIIFSTQRGLLEGYRKGACLSGSVCKCQAQCETFVDYLWTRCVEWWNRTGIGRVLAAEESNIIFQWSYS